MEFPKFKLIDSTTKETIGFEYLTIDGWKNEVYDYGEREGVFDEREMGDGFMGIIHRRLFTGYTLLGVEIYVGDEVLPGNFVEHWPSAAFVTNGDRPLVQLFGNRLNQKEGELLF